MDFEDACLHERDEAIEILDEQDLLPVGFRPMDTPCPSRAKRCF